MRAAAYFKYHIKTFAHGTQAHTHVLLTYCWFPSLLSSAFFFFLRASTDRERVVWRTSAAARCCASLPSLSLSRMCSVHTGPRRKTWHCPLGPGRGQEHDCFNAGTVLVPVVRSNYHSPGFWVYDLRDVAFTLFITPRTVIVNEKNNELLTFLPCQVCRVLYLYSVHDGRSV